MQSDFGRDVEKTLSKYDMEQLSKKQELLDEMAEDLERLIRLPDNCFARNRF
jgi:hypothetical protein